MALSSYRTRESSSAHYCCLSSQENTRTRAVSLTGNSERKFAPFKLFEKPKYGERFLLLITLFELNLQTISENLKLQIIGSAPIFRFPKPPQKFKTDGKLTYSELMATS